MKSQIILAAFAAVGVAVATAPVASVHAEPSTLEQVVHADARIARGGAITGDSVPFSVFEHTDVSAADILNRQELYHVNRNVLPAVPGYGRANAGGEIGSRTAHRAAGAGIVRDGRVHAVRQVGSEAIPEPTPNATVRRTASG